MFSKRILNLPTATVITFFIIFGLASLLRLYRLDDLMPFIGDYGRDFLAARDMITTGNWPLLGIPSSVPRFHQGPLYIWLLAPALTLGNFDPFFGALLAVSLGLLAVGLTFTLADHFFSTKVAAISTLILATSPLAIIHSRSPFHTNAIPLFSAIYLSSLFLFIKSKGKISPFWLALTFALTFQFELVVTPLILLVPLVFYLLKIKPTKLSIAHFFSGLSLGLIPQIIYDLTNNFKQLGLFVVWVGYRITSFLGIYSEHTASGEKLSNVLTTSFQYAQRFFSWWSPWPTILILLLIITPLLTIKFRPLGHFQKILFAWVGLMLISFIILGNASEAYFPILFIPISLLAAHSLNQISLGPLKPIIISSLLLLAALNSYYTIKQNYFTSPIQKENPFNTYGPPLSEQLAITDHILNNSTGPINLLAIGPGAQFNSHLDNYRYLLFWRANRATDPKALPVWIQPSTVNTRLLDTISYHFNSTIVSYPLTKY